jgi:hypothetical protein
MCEIEGIRLISLSGVRTSKELLVEVKIANVDNITKAITAGDVTGTVIFLDKSSWIILLIVILCYIYIIAPLRHLSRLSYYNELRI